MLDTKIKNTLSNEDIVEMNENSLERLTSLAKEVITKVIDDKSDILYTVNNDEIDKIIINKIKNKLL